MPSPFRFLFVTSTAVLMLGFPIYAEETVAESKAPPSQPSDEAPETEQTSSKLSHAEDGSFDVSTIAEKTHSTIPLVFPITEPAVGYGALGGLIFLEKPENTEEGETMRPNLTAVGGLATENGTWGAFAGDVRHYKQNTLQSMVAGGYASVNLTYSPPASESPPGEDPQTFEYNIKAPFLYLRGTYRFKESPWSV